MNIAIVYSHTSKYAEELATQMAKAARTQAIPFQDFDFHAHVDLLVLGFDCPCFGKPKEVEQFIKGLDRHYVKNIALFSTFMFSSKALDDMSDLCMKQDLPLMREQYCCKLPIELHCHLSDNAINGGIVYIDDMINICRDYY
ncbi:hypothetical protein [uncultured Catenibacterium sp.]|uniref:hypothetical protein n=1 Tax=uncultured Catenibacterium sp. TaxID=286142 RepID=UPI0025F585EE|nr:hypothetical protein [uncultured Catenibacterium sp.]